MSADESSRSSGLSRSGPLVYPANRVIGVVAPAALRTLVSALIDAGFAPIDILAGEASGRRLSITYFRPWTTETLC